MKGNLASIDICGLYIPSTIDNLNNKYSIIQKLFTIIKFAFCVMGSLYVGVTNFFRWHNHLNPNINKEAWTQDEELTLIRAHQIYGNKWAELTKFLPGRYRNSY